MDEFKAASNGVPRDLINGFITMVREYIEARKNLLDTLEEADEHLKSPANTQDYQHDLFLLYQNIFNQMDIVFLKLNYFLFLGEAHRNTVIAALPPKSLQFNNLQVGAIYKERDLHADITYLVDEVFARLDGLNKKFDQEITDYALDMMHFEAYFSEVLKTQRLIQRDDIYDYMAYSFWNAYSMRLNVRNIGEPISKWLDEQEDDPEARCEVIVQILDGQAACLFPQQLISLDKYSANEIEQARLVWEAQKADHAANAEDIAPPQETLFQPRPVRDDILEEGAQIITFFGPQT